MNVCTKIDMTNPLKRTKGLYYKKESLDELKHSLDNMKQYKRKQIQKKLTEVSIFAIMVGLSGLGPPTSRLSSGRSNQLS